MILNIDPPNNPRIEYKQATHKKDKLFGVLKVSYYLHDDNYLKPYSVILTSSKENKHFRLCDYPTLEHFEKEIFQYLNSKPSKEEYYTFRGSEFNLVLLNDILKKHQSSTSKYRVFEHDNKLRSLEYNNLTFKDIQYFTDAKTLEDLCKTFIKDMLTIDLRFPHSAVTEAMVISETSNFGRLTKEDFTNPINSPLSALSPLFSSLNSL